MRERGAMAALGSVLAHVALVCGFKVLGASSTAAARVERAPQPIEIVDVVPIDAVPIEVAFVTIEPAAETAAAAAEPIATPVRARGRGRGQGAITAASSSGTDTGTGTGTIETTAGASVGPSSSSQHGGALAVPIGTLIDIAERGGGVVVRTKNAETSDSTTSLQIEADGTAHFKDKGGSEVHMIVPASGQDLVDLIDDWKQDPLAHTREEGTIANQAAETGIVPIVGGSFGGGPDRARKQRLLAQTFDQRAEQRASHVAEQQGKADLLMRRNLERLWQRVIDPAERRELLFELWDECEEGDDAAGEAGQRARRQVIAWIRARLPAGSIDAYSGDDLAALNRRRKSTQRFRPY